MAGPDSSPIPKEDAAPNNERRGLRGRAQSLTQRGSVTPAHSSAWDQRHWSSRLLHRIGEITAYSFAGVLAATTMVTWLVVGVVIGFPTWWQAVLYGTTGGVTFVMVFVIQHTQARQTSATQRKLDELIRSSLRADDRLIAVEEAPDEHLQELTDRNIEARERATSEWDNDAASP